MALAALYLNIFFIFKFTGENARGGAKSIVLVSYEFSGMEGKLLRRRSFRIWNLKSVFCSLTFSIRLCLFFYDFVYPLSTCLWSNGLVVIALDSQSRSWGRLTQLFILMRSIE